MPYTSRHPVLADGLILGLAGAVAVGLWFLILGIVAGDILLVPAALGSVFVEKAMSPEEVRSTTGTVLAYAAIHLMVFAGVGLAVAWTVSVLRRHPRFWLVFLLGFIVMEGVLLGTAGGIAYPVLGELGWWAVVIGNVVAVAVMTWRVWVSHPVTTDRVTQVSEPRI